MFKYFGHYYWKEGKPYGSHEVDPIVNSISYKIITDPYHKRFSIEKYRYKTFDKVIYDSHLLDFRHLTLKDQMAWQREMLHEEENVATSLLRNQEDRALLLENLTFENNVCRACHTSSIHGIPLAIHRMYYRRLNDPFNGVILFDIEESPVMMKTYDVDPLTGEFTDLLKEEWNMLKKPF